MAKWSDNKRVADVRALDRTHFMPTAARNLAYTERIALLRLMCDLDFKAQQVRPSKTYEEPQGGVREPRKCSWCKQPTIFTTPRGRAVHPTCEGWVDDLTPRAQVELMYAVSDLLPIKSVEVENK